ncbi:hypothetical protein K2173_002062 [Erythroxylum novogranatense]|uniref:Histidine-containing phosphotransfer protein n=1 Tax=Erythroxylum novogranatense TaxID=1862640 RepID=A0AAV8SQ14_9ROSI|nr:hypothetical protein K2173_002062 [Erythroxylum novogranatense]
MALAALKAQLNNFVQSMLEEGMLDSQFAQVQALQDESNPCFITEVITSFCNDAERIVIELNKYMSHQTLDFAKLESFVHQLKGSSSSIGAKRLKLACTDLLQASDDRNKNGCLQALNAITREYCLLRNKFDTIIQLERRILATETRDQ